MALSGVKFLAGIPLSFAYHFTTLQTIIFTSTGGVLSLVIFLFCSDAITKAWSSTSKLFKEKFSSKKPIETEKRYSNKDINVDSNIDVQYYFRDAPVLKTKRKFSRKSRLFVKMKLKYGLTGIAFLTPILLSVPVGTFIATKLTHNKPKIFLYITVAILLWAIALTLLTHYFWP